MSTASPVVQLDLPLELCAKDEAFIAGFKLGHSQARNTRAPRAPLPDEIFEALHTFQRRG